MSVIEAIHQHRSIRKFKSDPIPDKLLNKTLEAGIRASSSGNMQTYSIIVTRDKGLRVQLHKAHLEPVLHFAAAVSHQGCDQQALHDDHRG